MISIAAFIPLLVSILSTNPAGIETIKFLNNERLDTAYYGYQQAVQNNLDYGKFLNLINCESRFEKHRWGDCEGGYGKEFCDSFGILQFQLPTFNWKKNIHKVNAEYTNWQNQIDLAILVLKAGDWRRWKTCSLRNGIDEGIALGRW